MFDLLPILYQTIVVVNGTQPCFENYTNFMNIFQNCMGNDYLKGVMVGWQWATGGYISMMFIAILVAFTYIKYHKAIYPIIVGTSCLPVAFFLFPSMFLTVALIFTVIGLTCLGVWIYISQTNES